MVLKIIILYIEDRNLILGPQPSADSTKTSFDASLSMPFEQRPRAAEISSPIAYDDRESCPIGEYMSIQ